MDDTRERVVAVTSSLLGMPADQIKDEHKFMEDLGADSLESIQIACELEDEFNVRIEDSTIQDIATVAEAVRHINKLLQAKSQQV